MQILSDVCMCWDDHTQYMAPKPAKYMFTHVRVNAHILFWVRLSASGGVELCATFMHMILMSVDGSTSDILETGLYISIENLKKSKNPTGKEVSHRFSCRREARPEGAGWQACL
jgi:hypothetical protein